jgi:hypothetical protein
MAAQRQYVYSALPPEYIRVLELYPGPPKAALTCRVVVQQIADKPYEAVSYTWGDPTPAALIKCLDDTNEGEIGIGANLAGALAVFRLPDRRRRLWVDMLCINQTDVFERQSQVRLMGLVYSNAECVLCWLGPFNESEDGEATARLAIQFLRNVTSQPEEHLRTVHDHLHSGEDTSNTDAMILAPWRAIKELFDLKYFHRTWIIQEVGLARLARMFWGRTDVWVDWTEVAAFSSLMDAKGASIVNHFQLKSWMASHINFIWTMNAAGEPVYSFVKVLHWARVHQSTDPRDYVYALMSHPSATVNGSPLVQPDYTISTAEAYTKLAVNIIEQTKSLQVLPFVDHDTDPNSEILPSWVPDWYAVNLVAPLRTPTHAAAETDNSITIAQSGTKMVLKCRGIIVDTLRLMSDMIDPNELIVKSLENEMKKKIPFLIDHIWNRTVAVPGVPLISPEQLLNSLSFVLTGCYRNEVIAIPGDGLEQLRADFAAFILKFERLRPSNPGGFVTSLTIEDRNMIEVMAATGSAVQFIQDMTWTSMCRKVFRTASGYVGLGPRIMREGDICAVLVGTVYPMILRSCDNYFLLIGPALLYGFMNGEAEELRSNGVLIEKDFLII